MAKGLKPRLIEPVTGTINLEGQIVGESRSAKNFVLNNVPGYPTGLIVPHGLGLKPGAELIGDATVSKVTYFEDANQEDYPAGQEIVRFELTGFHSLQAKLKAQRMRNSLIKDDLLAKAEHAAIPTLVMDASYFSKSLEGMLPA